MERNLIRYCLLSLLVSLGSCGENNNSEKGLHLQKEEPQISRAQLKQELMAKGYQVFDYIDSKTADTVLMQQYFIVFLKRGPNRSRDEKVVDSLQTLHLEHLGRMYDLDTLIFQDHLGTMGISGGLRSTTRLPWKWLTASPI